MAQTRQTIQNFYTQAQTKDFARDNLFRVLNISFGEGTTISFDEDDLVYAKTASLPGKEITSQALPYMGLNFNVPGVAKYTGSDGYTITFRCDESYDLRNRFLTLVNILSQFFFEEPLSNIYMKLVAGYNYITDFKGLKK